MMDQLCIIFQYLLKIVPLFLFRKTCTCFYSLICLLSIVCFLSYVCWVLILKQYHNQIITHVEQYNKFLQYASSQFMRSTYANLQQSMNAQQDRGMNEIGDKLDKFRNEIRMRQRENIFKNVRKQYQYLYTINNTADNVNNTQQCNNKQVNATKRGNQKQLQVEEYPLISRTLEKFHEIPHSEIWKYLNQIQQHLLQNNMYLSLLNEQNQAQDFDQQSLLIHDLFYLTLQHSPHFVFPRKFKFIRNGSYEVATYIAIVSNCVLPDQLVYWMDFMTEQERSIVYTNITVDEINPNTYKSNHLHYQSWINHPILRNNILCDLPFNEDAAKAIKQIVCFRKVHPDRLKNKKGESLYDILCKTFYKQLEEMKKQSKQNPSEGLSQCSEDKNVVLIKQQIEISVKVIQAKMLQGYNCTQLIDILSKILSARVESQIQLITPFFCQWVTNALLRHNFQVLNKIGYSIMISMMTYDADKFLTTCTNQQNQHICNDISGKVCEANLKKLENIIFKHHEMQQQNT